MFQFDVPYLEVMKSDEFTSASFCQAKLGTLGYNCLRKNLVHGFLSTTSLILRWVGWKMFTLQLKIKLFDLVDGRDNSSQEAIV